MSMHFCVQSATLYNSHIMLISLTNFNYHLSCPPQSTHYDIPQVVSNQLHTLKAQVQFYDGLHGICGGQSGNGAGFFHSASVFLCQFSYHVTDALHSSFIRGWHNMPHYHPTATANM